MNESFLNLIYFHKGDLFPEYIFDSIYQTILWNDSNLKIWILTEWKYISKMEKELDKLDNTNNIQLRCIPLEMFNSKIPDFKSVNSDFRGNFWGNTVIRFFYIYELVKYFNLEKVFHIENDVMIYKNFKNVYKKYYNTIKDSLVSIQDSDFRAINSYMYMENYKKIADFIKFITSETDNFRLFKNDMELMGAYKDKKTFNCGVVSNNEYIFDAAAIGQYLGGIDPRNTSEKNTKGFVNETSIFQSDKYTYEKHEKDGLIYWKCRKDDACSDIVNLHIHSKNLPEFSSKNNLYNIESDFKIDLTKPLEKQIITGELLLQEMDIIFIKNSKFINDYKFYQKPMNSLVIKIMDDYATLSEQKLKTIENIIKDLKIDLPKIFVYGDNIRDWYINIFKRLNIEKIDLYCHNSDENIYRDELFNDLLNNKNINRFYSQNLSTIDIKAKLIPIGIANSIWSHGNLEIFKDVLYKNYKYKKMNKIYVNVNKNTFIDRTKWMNQIDKLQSQNINVQKEVLKYRDYLEELVKYKYCFCPRGNGLDTHRFWESIYLGVVPIVINESNDDFVKILKNMNIQFIEIKSIDELIPLIK